jgi:hypothetical protein
MSRLEKFVALSWVERRLLLEVTVLVVSLRVGLLIFPFRTVQRAVDWAIREFPIVFPDRRWSPAKIVSAVNRVSSAVPGAT